MLLLAAFWLGLAFTSTVLSCSPKREPAPERCPADLDTISPLRMLFRSNGDEVIQALDPQRHGSCNLDADKLQIRVLVRSSSRGKCIANRITLCFDGRRNITYWTHHIFRPKQDPYEVRESINWNTTPVDFDWVYSSNDRHLTKGQLTPYADFHTQVERKMTCNYVNAAPQLGDVNLGNWKELEKAIRNMVKKSLDIYTGTYVYDRIEKLRGVVPVPPFFWKVVIDKESKQGVAFMGVNDVDHPVYSPCYTICEDLQWLSPAFLNRMSNENKGQIFCCSLLSFRRVPNIQLPNLPEVDQVLINP